jgi:peptide/nickel transport system substrate-binding protein
MQLKRLRRLVKRQVKSQQKQVEQFGRVTEKGLERNLFRRFGRLAPVRRFIFGWVLLVGLIMGCLIVQFQQLSAYYQRVEPVPGGIYSEGMAGSISNLNPIYASSDVDRSISKLLFTGLLRYDTNNNLVPSLASSYEVTDNGRTYTFKLKPNLTWHDGQPLTSEDVLFTFNTIKNPNARSPLESSWQKINITAPDAQTVVFTLPSTFAPFPYSLTTGIIPEHILGKFAVENLRSNEFNTVKPVGAGPFIWHGLQVTGDNQDEVEQQLAMLPFADYDAGKPKIGEFIMRVYASKERLQRAYASGQLTAAAGLEAIPADSPGSSKENTLLLSAGTYTFFKTSTPALSSAKTRQALVAASDPQAIINKLGYLTRPVTGPLLMGQISGSQKYAQKTNDTALAQQLLGEDGWQAGANGTLTKAGKPLSFSLVAADTAENRVVSSQLSEQWKKVGAKANVQLLSSADYATALAGHEYDATIYGISIGNDPDVYAYWHSSQADVRSTNRLNLSEWKNTTADNGLEAGRTRLDPGLRAVKYDPFLQAWQQDAPALGLYQPRYVYVTRGTVYGLTTHSIVSGVDRFNDVQDWQIRTARVTTK